MAGFADLPTIQAPGSQEGMAELPPTETEGAPVANAPVDRSFARGDVIVGSYVVERQLGQGGMGAVYLAADRVSGQRVAIKVLPASLARERDIRERFVLEARALAALDHPGIVPLVTFAQTGDDRFLVMKYVASPSLDLLLSGGVLDPSQARRILRSICEALAYAHGKGVIHRDIKPTNILVDSADNVVIVDFGIARSLERGRRVTETGMLMGTPQYMSPEQIRGDTVDGRADLYSCGLVLFEMLTGAPPFDGDRTFDVLRAHVEAPVPDVQSARAARAGASPVPDDLRAVAHALLAKHPSDRPASAAAVIELLDGRSTLPAPAPPPPAPPAPPTRAKTGAPRVTQETPALAYSEGEEPELDAMMRQARPSRAPWLLGAAVVVGLVAAVVATRGDADGGEVPLSDASSPAGASLDEALLLARGRVALEQGRLDDARIAVEAARHLSATPSAAIVVLDAEVAAAGGRVDAARALLATINTAALDDDSRARAARLLAPPPPPSPPPPSPPPSTRPSPSPSAPPPAPPPSDVPGRPRPSTLPDAELDAITGAARAEVARCYDAHVLVDDTVEDKGGTITVDVRVKASGEVRSARVDKTTIGPIAFQRCVIAAVKAWRFAPFDGVDDTIKHTYSLRPRG